MTRSQAAVAVFLGGLAAGVPAAAAVGSRSGTAAGSLVGFALVGGALLLGGSLMRDAALERAALRGAPVPPPPLPPASSVYDPAVVHPDDYIDIYPDELGWG